MRCASIAALLLSVAGAILVQAETDNPSFEAAAVRVQDPPVRPFAQIKFGRESLTLTGIDLSIGLMLAYGVRDYQIEAPDWVRLGRGGKIFDVVAKASGPVSPGSVASDASSPPG